MTKRGFLMTKRVAKSKTAKKNAKKFHQNEALNEVLSILAKASDLEKQSFSKKQKECFINSLVQQIS